MALLDRFRTQSRSQAPRPRRPPAVRAGDPARRARAAGRNRARGCRPARAPRRRRQADGSGRARRRRQETTPTSTCARRRSRCCATSRSKRSRALGEAESLAAVDARSTTPKTLIGIAKNALARDDRAARAGARDRRPRARIDCPPRRARSGAPRGVRRGCSDHAEILSVALNSEFKDPTLAAVERISDRGELEQIAARAKNKSASKRARAIVREMDDRARRRRAGRARRRRSGGGGRGCRGRRTGSGRDRQRRARTPSARRKPRGRRRARRAERQAREARDAAARPRSTCASGSRSCRANARSTSSRSPPPSGKGCRRSTTAGARGAAAALRARGARLPEAPRRVEGHRAAPRAAAELAADAARGAALEDLPAARKQFAAIRREWHDLGAGHDQRSRRHRALRRRAEPRSRRATPPRTKQDQKARREALTRAAAADRRASRRSPARADLTLKSGERALKDIRAALGAVPQLPSKKDYDEIVQAPEGGADGADAEGAGAARRRRLAALGERRHPGTALREDGGAQGGRRSRGDRPPGPRPAAAVAAGRRRAARAGRGAVEAVQDGARRGVDALRGALRGAGRSARREPREEDRARASAPKRWPTPPTGFRPPTRSRSCRPSGRRSARSAAARRRRSGSASAAPAIASSPAVTPISPSARPCGPRTSRRRKRCARRPRRSRESTDWDAAAAEMKRLQAEWKTIGPVKKSRSEAMWQRFRGACDHFFARYAQRHDIARGERVAAREAICAELEALAAPSPAAFAGLRRRRRLASRRQPRAPARAPSRPRI